jgi:hypothetical protein
MTAVKITEAQAQELTGTNRGDGVNFAPIQDVDGQWFISVEEQENCNVEWIKALPLDEVTIIVQIEP